MLEERFRRTTTYSTLALRIEDWGWGFFYWVPLFYWVKRKLKQQRSLEVAVDVVTLVKAVVLFARCDRFLGAHLDPIHPSMNSRGVFAIDPPLNSISHILIVTPLVFSHYAFHGISEKSSSLWCHVTHDPELWCRARWICEGSLHWRVYILYWYSGRSTPMYVRCETPSEIVQYESWIDQPAILRRLPLWRSPCNFEVSPREDREPTYSNSAWYSHHFSWDKVVPRGNSHTAPGSIHKGMVMYFSRIARTTLSSSRTPLQVRRGEELGTSPHDMRLLINTIKCQWNPTGTWYLWRYSRHSGCCTACKIKHLCFSKPAFKDSVSCEKQR